MATKSGDIFPMGYDNRMGNWTVIDHRDGTYSTYQHMQSHKIINESFVNKGDIIGYVGSTGNSTGAHLHFEIRIGEVGRAKEFYLMLPVNPLSYEYTNAPSNINIEKEAPIYSTNNGNSKSNNLFPYPERIIYRNIPMMQGNDVKWKSIKEEKSSVKLSWKKVTDADGYEVYMSESNGGKYKKVKTIKNGATLSYSKKDLEENKEYYFKVRAYYHIDDNKVNGAWSKVKKVGITQ